jgi:acetyl esterase/lipase
MFVLACLLNAAALFAAGDSAGGNLTITGLVYMRDRAAGTLQGPAAQAVAAAASQKQQQGQERPPFHPPLAAIMISPATDFTNSSVFRRGLPEKAQEQLKQQQQNSANGSAAGTGSTAEGVSASSGSRRDSTDELFHYDYVSKGEGNDVIRLYLPQPHDAAGLSDPLVSPMFIENFSGLVRCELLVVTGGCEAMVPDIERFVARVTEVSPELQVTHHVEEAQPHCYCVLHMGKLLEKGAAVLLPFMVRMCSGSSSSGSSAG